MRVEIADRIAGHLNKLRWHRTVTKIGGYGEDVHVAQPCYLSSPEQASIGSHVYIGPHAHIAADGGLTIGDGVMIGPWLYCQTSTHRWQGDDLRALPYDDRIDPGPVVIGDYVWIGGRVTILPGVTIGEGAIVGAGSVVASDVAALAVVVGNPAREVNRRDAAMFESLRGRFHLVERETCQRCGDRGHPLCERCSEKAAAYEEQTRAIYKL